MAIVQLIEREIKKLDEEDLSELRALFQEYDRKEWDRQIVPDSHAGALDILARKALAERKGGKTRAL